jgi:hypothetical protein
VYWRVAPRTTFPASSIVPLGDDADLVCGTSWPPQHVNFQPEESGARPGDVMLLAAYPATCTLIPCVRGHPVKIRGQRRPSCFTSSERGAGARLPGLCSELPRGASAAQKALSVRVFRNSIIDVESDQTMHAGASFGMTAANCAAVGLRHAPAVPSLKPSPSLLRYNPLQAIWSSCQWKP